MKYLKLFENFNQSEIDKICKKYNIQNYTINPDGSIDVNGHVLLGKQKLTELPLKFNIVSGDFYCYINNLTSLDGSPTYVGGNFNCYINNLTSLDGSPTYVGGIFYCPSNLLTSLEGCPNYVGGSFYCDYNKLTSLIGDSNYVGGDFYCSYNQLTSLMGCPKEVGGDFYCSYNPISPIIDLFDDVKIYLDYQETFNFLRKDCKVVKHLLEDAIKDFSEYYNKNVELPEKIEGYTYI
jgi:hypothetical protein